MKTTGQLPIESLTLQQAIKGLFNQYGWDAPTEFVFAVIGRAKFEAIKSDPKWYINRTRSKYRPPDSPKPRREMNNAEKALVPLDCSEHLRASLDEVIALKHEIGRERGAADPEYKELEIAERALKKLATRALD